MNQSNTSGQMPEIPLENVQQQQQQNQPVQPKKTGGCLKIGLIIFAVLLIIGLFASLIPDNKGDKTSSEDNNENIAAESASASDSVTVSQSEETAATNWSYSESVDEMTDKMTYTASVTSENAVNFDFPYDGGSYLTLTIRQSPQYGKDAYIHISKGQFNSGVYGENIKVRFDDEQPITFSCVEPSDNSSDLLFIQNYKKFVTKLKTANTVKISVEFFNEGVRVFTFNTKGLVWEH